MLVKLADITVDHSIQCRVQMSEETIQEYLEKTERGIRLPPVIAYKEPSGKLWLADGFHRVEAFRLLKKTEIEADVRHGGKEGASEFALGANETNGLHRTKADKANAVKKAIEKWPNLSGRAIADKCNVAESMVRRHKGALKAHLPNKTTGRDGKEYPSTQKSKTNPREKPSTPDSESPPATVTPDPPPVATKPVATVATVTVPSSPPPKVVPATPPPPRKPQPTQPPPVEYPGTDDDEDEEFPPLESDEFTEETNPAEEMENVIATLRSLSRRFDFFRPFMVSVLKTIAEEIEEDIHEHV